MERNRKFLVLFIVTVVIGALIWVAIGSAHAAEDCVPSDAYAETIEHPEVSHTEVVTITDKEAWTETISGLDEIWANFQPNNQQETFVGPAVFPVDPRGSWNVHSDIPGGHEGPDGVYSKGNPDKGGNWFFRQAGTDDVVINHPAVTHEETRTIVDSEAWTETIEHPAVTCDDEPPVVTEPCPDDTLILNPETGECEDNEPPWTDGTPPPVVEDPEPPVIEVPKDGEIITHQTFDKNGTLIAQRVSAPIPAEAKQEGM